MTPFREKKQQVVYCASFCSFYCHFRRVEMFIAASIFTISLLRAISDINSALRSFVDVGLLMAAFGSFWVIIVSWHYLAWFLRPEVACIGTDEWLSLFSLLSVFIFYFFNILQLEGNLVWQGQCYDKYDPVLSVSILSTAVPDWTGALSFKDGSPDVVATSPWRIIGCKNGKTPVVELARCSSVALLTDLPFCNSWLVWRTRLILQHDWVFVLVDRIASVHGDNRSARVWIEKYGNRETILIGWT